MDIHKNARLTKSAVAILEAAITYLAKLGVQVERVMTDNGSCYRSKAFRAACKRLGLRQIFTKPHTRQNQWQSRALHSDCFTRVGLCSGLPQLRPTIR